MKEPNIKSAQITFQNPYTNPFDSKFHRGSVTARDAGRLTYCMPRKTATATGEIFLFLWLRAKIFWLIVFFLLSLTLHMLSIKVVLGSSNTNPLSMTVFLRSPGKSKVL